MSLSRPLSDGHQPIANLIGQLQVLRRNLLRTLDISPDGPSAAVRQALLAAVAELEQAVQALQDL